MIGIGQRRSGRLPGLRSAVRRGLGPGRKVMICAACELTGRARDPDEARYLVNVHEQLHHGRVPRQNWPPQDFA